MQISQIEGAWELQSFHIHSPEGKISPWGNGTHGLLLYLPTGNMSVSINSEIEATDAGNLDALFDSILFYAGTYRIDGNKILHFVTEASNPNRINKEMIRYAELQGETLTITTPNENFGKAIIVWRKIK